LKIIFFIYHDNKTQMFLNHSTLYIINYFIDTDMIVGVNCTITRIDAN